VVGAVVLLLAGGGISFMTSPHPFVADGFFVSGAILFLAKFVTWEEAHAQANSRSKVVGMGVAITLVVLFIAIGGNHILNRPPRPLIQATALKLPQPDSGPALPRTPTELKLPPAKTPRKTSSVEDNKQPTLPDLFKSGFPNTLKLDGNSWGLVSKQDGTQILSGPTKVYLDFDAKTKFIAFYVPRSEHAYEAALGLWSQVPVTFDSVQKSMVVTAGYGANMTDLKDLTFSGRVFLYHEDMFNLRQLADLVDAYKSHEMALDFRGPEFLMSQVTAWYHQHGAKGVR
jgi:hypothetical protein